MANVGDSVTVLPGDSDTWEGKAIVREVSTVNAREHLVEIVATGEEVWFDQQRFVELLRPATCPSKSMMHCHPKWCKHCFRQVRNLDARLAEKQALLAKWNRK